MNQQNYGYIFNCIDICDDIVIKCAKNEYGRKKINYEIEFYEYINTHHVKFPMPKLVFSDKIDSILKIEYLKDYQVANKTDCDSIFINSILQHINDLHKHIRLPVQRQEYIDQLKIESLQKVVTRFNETDWQNIPRFNEITHVNNVKIHNLHYYIKKINDRIDEIVLGMPEYQFALIHGDINLGNIMTNSAGDIRFIDPRGYFGDMSLFGIEEYDFAKLLFGLSGYNVFDEMVIDHIDIVDGNIELPIEKFRFCIFENENFSEYTKLLTMTIWLSNNSMYSSPYKKLYSLIIAYYFCEKYFAVN